MLSNQLIYVHLLWMWTFILTGKNGDFWFTLFTVLPIQLLVLMKRSEKNGEYSLVPSLGSPSAYSPDSLFQAGEISDNRQRAEISCRRWGRMFTES